MSAQKHYEFHYIPEEDIPLCSVEGCDNVSQHTDVKHNGQIFPTVCDPHKEEMIERGLEHPDRPVCKRPDCDRLAQLSHISKTTGKRYWKTDCAPHGKERWEVNLTKNSSTLDLLESFGKPNERTHCGDLLPLGLKVTQWRIDNV